MEKTTLSAIISAAKIVADRLNFLRGLELLVFEKDLKKQLKERSQLHRILANETWIFGEEFHLTVDDEGLSEVLTKHLKQLGREQEDAAVVTCSDGSRGVVDLMLSRRIPQHRAEEREHLVVELKRPTVDISRVEHWGIPTGKRRFLGSATCR